MRSGGGKTVLVVSSEESDRKTLRWVRIIAWSAGALSLIAILAALLPGRTPTREDAAQVAPPPDLPVVERVQLARSTTPQRARAAAPGAASAAQSKQSLFPEPLPAGRQLVHALANFELQGGAWTDEQVTAWKQKLVQLIEHGALAIPALREFLTGNADLDFGDAGKQLLGYGTARGAMIDALAQIGGPLAIAALSDVLQISADPHEVSLLAQNLEKLEPGLHKPEFLEAARQTLAMASTGGLPDRDVAPLFELFQKFGSADAVAELQHNAGQWNFYSMIALAQLPESAGLPALMELASDHDGANSTARLPALQLLAQVASQSADARVALVDQARYSKLTPYNWAALVPSLAGERLFFQESGFDNTLSIVDPNDLRKTHVSSGNQSFYSAPAGPMTLDQFNQQKALIDELLAVTKDPAGVQSLNQAKDLLTKRFPQVASAPGN